jgi:hypothetical protein
MRGKASATLAIGNLPSANLRLVCGLCGRAAALTPGYKPRGVILR